MTRAGRWALSPRTPPARSPEASATNRQPLRSGDASIVACVAGDANEIDSFRKLPQLKDVATDQQTAGLSLEIEHHDGRYTARAS